MSGRPRHHHSNFYVTTSKIFQRSARITRIDVYYELPKILMKHMKDSKMNCPYDLIIFREENEEYENTIDRNSERTLANLLCLVSEETIKNIGWRPSVQTLLKSFVRHYLRANAENPESEAEICRMATDRIIEDDDINLNILAPNGILPREKFRPLIGKIVKVFLKWKRFLLEHQ